MLITFKTAFIVNSIHEKGDNKMVCVGCIMFGIANKNYLQRPNSNSYLAQQFLS